MITRLNESERGIGISIARKWAKKTGIPVEKLEALVNEATREVYQSKPFTTAIIKKTVCGRHVRGAGFTKYMFSDEKLGWHWDETAGRRISLSRAYNDFMANATKIISNAPIVQAIVCENECSEITSDETRDCMLAGVASGQ